MTDRLAADVLVLLGRRGLTLATAESLTGGGLGAALTEVPGASAVYVGGVVSYATRVKVDVLGVPVAVVERDGVVSAACAAAMAQGVRQVLGAHVGVSTTGVAGPEEQEGRSAGTVFVGVASPEGTVTEELALPGGRGQVRRATVEQALRLLRERLA